MNAINSNLAKKVIWFTNEFGLTKALNATLFYSYFNVMKKILPLTKEHIISTNGYKLATRPNDIGLSPELILFKIHEPVTTQMLYKELECGMVCLDIGANIGYYALMERKLVGEKGKVIAIEPEPNNFKCLKKNIALNGFDDIKAFKFAFSSSDGETSFLVDKHSNRCRIPSEYDFVLNNSANNLDITVRKKRLDTFVSQYKLDKLDFLRMDVEGHEDMILQGGIETIKRFKPFIQLEVHKDILGLKRTVNLLNSLETLGYKIKYCVPRALDFPFLGNKKDILKTSFNQVIKELNSKNIAYNYFQLFIKHN